MVFNSMESAVFFNFLISIFVRQSTCKYSAKILLKIVMKEKVILNWYESVDSTMNVAARNMDTAPDMSVYVADYQTQGRGQRGNRWESCKAENLTFTILMRPEFLKAQQQFVISEVSALSVAAYLKGKGVPVKIKWPNDIYAADKKICGMLIEHTLCGANLSVSTSGIGININQKEFDSSLPNPTSLILETGEETPYDRKRELLSFLSIFCDYYSMARAGEYGRLEQEYLSCLYRKGEYFKYIDCRNSAEETIEAKIIGIDQCACLLLEKRDGSVDSYSFKEIKYII